jgi:hypothetical protein
MANEPSPYEQYKQQRRAARFARAQQGRTTHLDHAEERHEAIGGFVENMRFFGAPILCLPLCAIVPDMIQYLAALAICYFVSWVVVRIPSLIVNAVLGAFFPSLSFWIETLGLSAAGIWLAVFGASHQAGAIVIAGLVFAAWPFVWLTWSRSVMGGTRYARLMQESNDPHPPRIIE